MKTETRYQFCSTQIKVGKSSHLSLANLVFQAGLQKRFIYLAPMKLHYCQLAEVSVMDLDEPTPTYNYDAFVNDRESLRINKQTFAPGGMKKSDEHLPIKINFLINDDLLEDYDVRCSSIPRPKLKLPFLVRVAFASSRGREFS